ncbi:hypothetical protein LTR95_013634 [Oleoguttula sp. CCFEE 5521]
MSSGLMSTEPGGEQTQYEAEHNDVLPSSKSSGQLGASQEHTKPGNESVVADQQKAERGEKTAENIRYGQKLSEEGFGGVTTGQEGGAGVGKGEGGSDGEARAKMGYSGGKGSGEEIGG